MPGRLPRYARGHPRQAAMGISGLYGSGGRRSGDRPKRREVALFLVGCSGKIMQVLPVSAESLPGLLLRRSEKLKQAIAEPPQIDALQTHVPNLYTAWAPDSLSGTCHRLGPLDCIQSTR